MMGLAVSDGEMNTKSMPEIYIMLRSLPHVAMKDFIRNPRCLSKTVSKATPVIYLENGFVVTTGENLQNAFDRMEVAEFAAESMTESRQIGKCVSLHEDEIHNIEDAFKLY
jgi:L-fuculose-phosphate aldolase